MLSGLALWTATILQAKDLQKNQTWTSTDGRSIEAELLHFHHEKEEITLRRADGLKFTIRLEQLSVEDQKKIIKNTLESKAELPNKPTKQPKAQIERPTKFILKRVPMIKQHSNFCVPASASMISGYHGIKTDQDEIAQLSSEGSASNRGTYPSDMLLAMQKLGFTGNTLQWDSESDFLKNTLPKIRQKLLSTGPIYISFKPGVFGTMGHGCVIIGYDDRKEELHFHNPWGNKFKKDYNEIAVEGYGVVVIDPRDTAPIASEVFIEKIQNTIPSFPGPLSTLYNKLSKNNIKAEIIWCSRRDERDNKNFAKSTARRDGRKILDLAFERSPAVFIPHSPKGETNKYLLVTRPKDGGADYPVMELSDTGWSDIEERTLGSLTREWTTYFEAIGEFTQIWELPMIELSDTTQ